MSHQHIWYRRADAGARKLVECACGERPPLCECHAACCYDWDHDTGECGHLWRRNRVDPTYRGVMMARPEYDTGYWAP